MMRDALHDGSGIGSLLAPDFQAMPVELRERHRWVTWKLSKGRKVPFCATAPKLPASVVDPHTWATFEQAQAAYNTGGFSGVGFVLTAGDPIVGIDLDKCVTHGEAAPEAMRLMDRIGCGYIELSPSAKGLHGLGYGDDIASGTRGTIDGVRVELYSGARYFTVTGRPLISGPFVQMPAFAEFATKIRKRGSTEENGSGQKRTEDFLSPLLFSSVDSIAIPPSTLPRHEGERHHRLFELARYLKALRLHATWSEKREFATRWHVLAQPHIATKELAETLDDFARAFEKVRIPHGDVLRGIVRSIDHDAALPRVLEGFGYGETMTRLVRLCMALATHNEPEPFFLDVRTAGAYLNVHYTYAWKLLSVLHRDGVLSVVSKGSDGKATRYRFTPSTMES
ncbi:hypothetical protein QTI24_29175 [Variovorax sp. J22P240]|uniref:hypothetical protein n=1 Tax=Variovorax sp. J22P240 TaxID=3053514 RepID=UPI0025755675|nr:hypothetical protein [Variovorax sp. J22P240]MDM0002705.1 hypothetical protein [Variovorax sp. J22P240]